MILVSLLETLALLVLAAAVAELLMAVADVGRHRR